MEQEIQLNEHNKQEYPPMHTAEHLLNSQMVKYFHCRRHCHRGASGKQHYTTKH